MPLCGRHRIENAAWLLWGLIPTQWINALALGGGSLNARALYHQWKMQKKIIKLRFCFFVSLMSFLAFPSLFIFSFLLFNFILNNWDRWGERLKINGLFWKSIELDSIFMHLSQRTFYVKSLTCYQRYSQWTQLRDSSKWQNWESPGQEKVTRLCTSAWSVWVLNKCSQDGGAFVRLYSGGNDLVNALHLSLPSKPPLTLHPHPFTLDLFASLAFPDEEESRQIKNAPFQKRSISPGK